ncbi:MAG: sigma-70 family RNA polymerase sigma factor [Planctomycetales bacterium]|nr:sigma-70 family RNA polymerase sigma factor [Planctomycetales bacterium]
MDPSPTTPAIESLLSQEGWLRGLARHLLYGDVDVDDVVQETWLAVFRSPPKRPEHPRGWLATVLRNLIRRRRRVAEAREHRESAVATPEALPSTVELVERASIRREVIEAVLALEEPYRTAILLRYFEDLPPRDVAERLGVPVETLRTRLKRALEQIRQRLDQRRGGDRRAWGLALVPLADSRGAAAARTGAALLAPGSSVTLALGALAATLVLVAGVAVLRPTGSGRALDKELARSAVVAMSESESDRPPGAGPGPNVPHPTRRAGAAPAASGEQIQGPQPEGTATSLVVAGTVRISTIREGERGAGIPGILVIGEQGDPPREIARVETDAAGQYRLAGFVGGQARIRLEVSASPQWFWSGLLEDNSLNGERFVEVGATDTDFALMPTAPVRIRVVDSASGLTIPDAQVAGQLPWIRRREEDRIVVFTTLGGVHTLTVSAPGYLPRVLTLPMVLPPGLDISVPVGLERGVVLSGWTRNPAGDALRWVSVFAEPLDATGGRGQRVALVATSDESGAFRTEPLAPGRHRFCALGWGVVPAVDAFPVHQDVSGHVFVLAERGERATPRQPEFRWEERRDLQLDLRADDVPALEVLQWVEALAGVRVGRHAETDQSLSEARINTYFSRTTLEDLLAGFAGFLGLEFDRDSGELRTAPRDERGGGG